jgi:peptidoglycan hydrolase-like protein with peptidoglycan-binding domain
MALAVGVAGAAIAQTATNTGTSPGTPQPAATAPTGSPANQAQPGAAQPQAAAQSRIAPNEQVRQAQQGLQAAGLYKGPVDGVMDPDTRAALAKFQQQNGLPRTEGLDQQTMARLMSTQSTGSGSSAPTSGPTPAPSSGQAGNPPSAAGGSAPGQPMQR